VKRARVLVVDDSVVIRRIVTNVVAADPALECIGAAPDGRVALAHIDRDAPDLVVLDVARPGLDGIATLARIRDRHPDVRVVMFSVLTERGAAATLDALSLGAVDYARKPSDASGPDAALAAVRAELLPKLKAFAEEPRPGDGPWRLRRAGGAPAAVAVAASTGGPDAVARLVAALPADFPLPVVVVQHMPREFTRLFARRLDGCAELAVAEAEDGAPLARGRVWIAPGGRNVVVGPAAITLSDGAPGDAGAPSADRCFASAARAFGPGAVGVVLTGMGRDGLRGSAAIVDAGGTVLVQDRESSVVWGMPGRVAEASLAHVAAPPETLAALLVERAGAETVS
jgi:two-component system chemotaxis response regulator CheB